MIYESELYELFIEEAQIMYGLNSEDRAYKYLRLRHLINNYNKNKLDDIDNPLSIAKFLIDELNIYVEDGYFTYKNEKIYIGNTVYDIVVNWEFRASLVSSEDIVEGTAPLSIFIKLVYSNILKTAKRKAKKFKNNNDYSKYVKHYALKELNTLFKTTVIPPRLFKDVCYGINHNQFKKGLEEEIEAHIHSIEFLSDNIALVSEEDVENFIIRNIEKIEEGMKYIERQVVVDNGRIDVLARDKNNIYTIIEIKTSEDKDLVWQCMYYPEAIKKKFNTNKVRMITLCPGYETHIYRALNNIGNIEMCNYKLEIELGKIKSINVCQLLN